MSSSRIDQDYKSPTYQYLSVILASNIYSYCITFNNVLAMHVQMLGQKKSPLESSWTGDGNFVPEPPFFMYLSHLRYFIRLSFSHREFAKFSTTASKFNKSFGSTNFMRSIPMQQVWDSDRDTDLNDPAVTRFSALVLYVQCVSLYSPSFVMYTSWITKVKI